MFEQLEIEQRSVVTAGSVRSGAALNPVNFEGLSYFSTLGLTQQGFGDSSLSIMFSQHVCHLICAMVRVRFHVLPKSSQVLAPLVFFGFCGVPFVSH